MNKIIFLGTDLHGELNELATKTVKRLTPHYKKHKVLSIQHIQDYSPRKNTWVVPRASKIRKIRLIFIGLLLPLYLLILRMLGYNKIAMFWTADYKYHLFLFKFLKLLRYKLFFTIISDYTKNYNPLKFCDKIICQSDRMKRFIKKKFPTKDIEVIYPGVDLEVFKPSKKKNIILIPSTPYNLEAINFRNLITFISLFRKHKINSRIITRSSGVGDYLEKQKIPLSKIINKTLTDPELAKELSDIKLIPIIYQAVDPDMPLSGIEGLASGCAIICSDTMGLAEIIQKNKCGFVAKKLTIEDIRKIFNNLIYNKRARITAQKYFDFNKNLLKYKNIFDN